MSADRRFPRGVFGTGPDPDTRFTLANERTFLAWTRTSLALVAGAVAVHSPFFELDTWVSNLASLWLLVLAALCVAQAWLRWRAVEKAIRTGSQMPGFGAPALLAVAVGVLIVSVAVGVVVVAVR
jgi:putative membrane protein